MNLVHRQAPEAAIAFNDAVDDVVDAVQRRLRGPPGKACRNP